ncbi:diphthine--ammonia ligase [Tenacibaculum sp. C7A-26P2]|uniref:Dph6-related ATP pyrophosphatase n=1 Tax=Tenacibaculum sp. C7A-26P2 TaxID=3447504 RepID=UPI003F82B4A6
MKKAYFNWSSGKDSALALYKVLKEKKIKVDKLVTSMNRDYKRVSMHGLHESLLEVQAKSIGIALHKIYFSSNVTMKTYEGVMDKEMTCLREKGFYKAVFGDIFLEDLRNYRDLKLKEAGLLGVYPLWKQNTKTLLNEFLSLGFKAITVCVNADLLGKEFVGRIIDEEFIKELPENVDICGENGEFHTFCFDGPIFSKAIDFEIGEKVLKSYPLLDDNDNCFKKPNQKDKKTHSSKFWYCDLKMGCG